MTHVNSSTSIVRVSRALKITNAFSQLLQGIGCELLGEEVVEVLLQRIYIHDLLLENKTLKLRLLRH